ncbi:formylglycine-generating enzyme family protein [Aeromicrobium sp. Sec7.5]|uniref:formylglycine-generating enzyme family protein n=1 Tax=Aeromicrobium sp. Sec7.5 TaxID=3121276 RepID=UPI002FE44E28
MTAPDAAASMQLIPAGAFWMGSDDAYPDEAPAHRREVEAFWIDVTAVTNEQFAQFVEATGHVTGGERPHRGTALPGPHGSVTPAGSAVFGVPDGPVDLASGSWWSHVAGASWRAPEGPGSDLRGRAAHPVVHVTHADATAYAQWCGKRLPTEAEWERAARGGLDRQEFAWGDEREPGGVPLATTWPTDTFPVLEDGGRAAGTTPVGTHPANGYGLLDMIGNVWEWTSDRYEAGHRPAGPCCGPGPRSDDPLAAVRPSLVLKGGSYLCAPNYCRRYRPAARIPLLADDSASNVGFRCVVDEPAAPTHRPSGRRS